MAGLVPAIFIPDKERRRMLGLKAGQDKSREPMPIIYKILPASLWQEAQRDGVFVGAPVDLADGYIHFSTAEQVEETAAKHFSGQRDLMLLHVDAQALGDALKWEPSRGGALFPHLYARLDVKYVTRADPLPLGDDGRHVFPPLSPAKSE
jgi:uncharacterized protein (DUF952 family)